MSGRATLDDAELRRTLDALLSRPASASVQEGASAPPERARPGAREIASDPRHDPERDWSQRHRTSEGWMVGRRGLVVLGFILVVIGGLLLTDTLGVLALDTSRLADYWPLVFVLLGLLVLLEAWAPDRHSEVREPAVGTTHSPDVDELERRLQERLDRLLAPRPTEASSPGDAAPAVATPQARQPVGDREPRQADVAAALLELQGLRRNRLISKREYRAQRSELVARMRPLPVAQPCVEPAAVGEGGMDDEGLPDSGYAPG